MRDDFDKVIIERPRTGRGMARRSLERRFESKKLSEDAPNRESTSRNRGGTKNQTDVLGPMKRFLAGKVGQYWDKVYSEICQTLDLRSMRGSHFLDHLDWYVIKNCIIIDGEVLDSQGRELYRGNFYVCPKSGILKKLKNRTKWKAPPPITLRVEKDATHEYHKINDIWYELTLNTYDRTGYVSVFDCAYSFTASGYAYTLDQECYKHYGRRVYAVAKRQLNRREIKKLKLNDKIAA